MCSTICVCACQVHRWTCPWVEIQVSMIIRPHATREHNPATESRARSTQRSVSHTLSGPTRKPLTPALVCATSSKLSTWLLPGRLVEQISQTHNYIRKIFSNLPYFFKFPHVRYIYVWLMQVVINYYDLQIRDIYILFICYAQLSTFMYMKNLDYFEFLKTLQKIICFW